MRETRRWQTWVRRARTAAFGAGFLVLGGCATGYSFVQPGVAGSGGYYTGESYSGQGYYDYYGTGPYYPGTGGYGYYDGTYPYGGAYGYYSPGYGYGPGLTFNLGISNVWDFPGYWGPWYTTGFPLWGCSWHCGDRDHWGGHRHERGDHDDYRGHGNFDDRGDHDDRGNFGDRGDHGEKDGFANHPAMASSPYRHDRFVRAPRRLDDRFVGVPARPAYNERRVPNQSGFVDRSFPPAAVRMTAPMPQAFNRPARIAPEPDFQRALPARSAPGAPPPTRHRDAGPGVKIP